MKIRRPLPPLDKLRSLLKYEASSGSLILKKRDLSEFSDSNAGKMWNARYAGTVAGHRHQSSYLRVSINDVNYAAHRLVWKICIGREPSRNLDHIDHDRTNNRIENLREVSGSQNRMNSRVRNNSGASGVYWHERDRRWTAEIWINRNRILLGRFLQRDDAIAARKEAEIVHFGDHRYQEANDAMRA